MTKELSLVLEPPLTGGITIRIANSDATFVDNFSHIYPSLERLCSCVADVGGRNEGCDVELLLEPHELVLQFRPQSSEISELAVLVRHRHSRGVREELVLSHASSSRDLVLVFWRALRRLQTSLPPAAFERQWGSPFPEAEMASLTRLVESWKVA